MKNFVLVVGKLLPLHSNCERKDELCTKMEPRKILILANLKNRFRDLLVIEKYKLLTQQKIKIMSEIESKVKSIIVDKLGVDEAEVKPEASFTNDLGADSLDTVELIMEFEKSFGISIPDDEAEKISTVGDAISYIEEHAK